MVSKKVKSKGIVEIDHILKSVKTINKVSDGSRINLLITATGHRT